MPEGTGEFGAAGARGGGARDDDVGAARQCVAFASETIAENALDPVSDDGAGVDLARHGEPEPGGAIVGEMVQGEDRVRGATPGGEDRVEFRTRAYPRGARVAGCRSSV
jgi:hypothetical protein